MTNLDDDEEHHVEVEEEEALPTRAPIFVTALNTLARIWVICLLLLAAGFAGVAVNQYWQARSELRELRADPGPDAYAVVAYRHELQRQIDLYRRDWRAEAIPTPPPRPRLLEEIDLQRRQNRHVSPSAGGTGQVVNAPQ